MRLLLLALFLGCAHLTAADFTIGQDAPDFELGTSTWDTPEGFTRLSSYRGKVVLVEVWATY
ncbi:MAG: hypothetical protein IPP14_04660 [Planctomycetes bacterium]|nr:hypothetical protein [Planctomycetota bacterium]